MHVGKLEGEKLIMELSQSEIEDAVVELIRERGRIGRQKYRASMDRRDLHPAQWARHLQEELGDALQYAERVRLIGELLLSAREIMANLAKERGWEVAETWIKAHDAHFLPNAKSSNH